jgi:hypothetical protein
MMEERPEAMTNALFRPHQPNGRIPKPASELIISELPAAVVGSSCGSVQLLGGRVPQTALAVMLAPDPPAQRLRL